MATADHGVQLSDRGQDHCALSGALTLSSVPALWKQLESAGWLTRAREADLAGVGATDSAGLAMLVAWKAACRKAGAELVFRSVPERLNALAALTDAGGLLESAR